MIIIPSMEGNKRVLCSENEELASYIRHKIKELSESPKGISDNIDATLSKAFNNVCNATNPIKTLKDLSQIKGVGKWVLRLMQGFFDHASHGSEPKDLFKKAMKDKGTKRYVPQKNSVAYALLITLYRASTDGKEFLHKQVLIDMAEASGLSRAAVLPEKVHEKSAKFGNSAKVWHTGWSCMKTLITKGLVVKSSCPAKYMLTEEGMEIARECLTRSRMLDPKRNVANLDQSNNLDTCKTASLQSDRSHFLSEATLPSVSITRQAESINVPFESLERLMKMGYTKEQVLRAFSVVSKTHQKESSVWLAVLCFLREDMIYSGFSNSHSSIKDSWSICDARFIKPNISGASDSDSFSLKACSSFDHVAKESCFHFIEEHMDVLSIPPLSSGEKFEDKYEVILILDNREQFAIHGSKNSMLIKSICKEHKIKIEVRWLPIGDGLWVARHKYLASEYVLDFIIERKRVDDLCLSIRDNRYKDQKLRLMRCGLRKMIYLVEGDPNSSEVAESIKTACFTTEILEGFDVHRTRSLTDTLRKYAYLTRSISQYYQSYRPSEQGTTCASRCPLFDDFIKKCRDFDQMTVGDVFATQLMQVPHVTEEIALVVLKLYPTLRSLACAYSLIEGDVRAQEEMIRKRSNNGVTAVASRNIYRFVWAQ